MTAILNIIYKLGAATNIIIGLSLIDGIKTAINIFTSVLSRGIPCLNRLK
jgi:hypothetical protein